MLELISIHIPKTAGTSFYEVLKANYPGRTTIWKRVDVEEYLKSGQIDQNAVPEDISALHGHFQVSEIRALLHPQLQLITWVREPVERVISNYYFFQHRIAAGKTRARQQKRFGESLVEYASGPNTRNQMTAYLEGVPRERFHFIGLVERYEEDLRILARKMAWKEIPLTRLNTGPEIRDSLPPITESDRQRVAELNNEDMALYEQIKHLRKL